jgi:hypothetical protein
MAGYGYGYVTAKGFVACEKDLSEGAWGAIAIAPYDTPERKLSPGAQAAPRPALWKLRVVWSLEDLKGAIGTAKLDQLDADWDGTQRRLYHRLGVLREDRSQVVREAAERASDKLLEGRGTDQTTYDYDDEVDFGRNQVLLTQSGQLRDDVKMLGLDDAIADIDVATEALAKGLGRKDNTKRQAPSARQRDAVSACAAAFNGVHDDLAWWIEHTASGPDQDQLHALLAPLEALLSRNPPPPPKEAPAAQPAAPAKDAGSTAPTKDAGATPAKDPPNK